jgi:hypothetical protein
LHPGKNRIVGKGEANHEQNFFGGHGKPQNTSAALASKKVSLSPAFSMNLTEKNYSQDPP